MIFRRNDQKLSLAVCYTVFCKEEVRIVEYREQIKKAMDFIEEHLNQEIRAEDAAAAAGFSQYHFQRIFKNETGLPV